MERVEHTESTIEVFENEIDEYLHLFMEEQGIEDLGTVPQSVWNGALRYIYRNVFKGNKQALKEHNNIYSDNTITPTNCNSYNYNIVNEVLDYYIYLCQIYNKEISIMGFSNLTGIDTEVINNWGNEVNISSASSSVIYKKLSQMREESLSNKLADGKQNPVGVIAMLNRHYGWASPYTSDSNKQKSSLPAAELPKLGQNAAAVGQIAQSEIVVEQSEKP